jgi:hypothetical protein
MRIASLTLLALCLAVVPAVAQNDVYDNGPTNGTTDGWTINFGFAVSDTFNLTAASTINGLNFAAWAELATFWSLLKSRSPRANSAAPATSIRPSTSRRAVALPTSWASTSAPSPRPSPVRASMPAPTG